MRRRARRACYVGVVTSSSATAALQLLLIPVDGIAGRFESAPELPKDLVKVLVVHAACRRFQISTSPLDLTRGVLEVAIHGSEQAYGSKSGG